MNRQVQDALFTDYVGGLPGASILLRTETETISAAYGYANLETGELATIHTNYRLASVSKQFTAMAALILVAQEKLSLETTINHFFADAPAFWQNITIEHLLTHASGLRDYEELIPEDFTRQLEDNDVLYIARHQHDGYFEPGSEYRYSNTAYCLLALIIAQVANTSFPQFLKEQIFTPLGMHGSIVKDSPDVEIANRAYGYSRRLDTWYRTDQSLTSATMGDGGVYSSIHDLALWDTALHNGELLPYRLYQRMFEAQNHIRGNLGYGYGWYVRGQQVYHTGDSIGFRNCIIRRLDRKHTAIVLSNRKHGGESDILALTERLFNSRVR